VRGDVQSESKRQAGGMKKTSDPRIGQQGQIEITWPNGRRVIISGTVLAIDQVANEVYLDSYLGAVVGDLDSLEMAESI
jgi:hypothetical protein